VGECSEFSDSVVGGAAQTSPASGAVDVDDYYCISLL